MSEGKTARKALRLAEARSPAIKILSSKVDSAYIANQTTRMTDSIEDDPDTGLRFGEPIQRIMSWTGHDSESMVIHYAKAKAKEKEGVADFKSMTPS